MEDSLCVQEFQGLGGKAMLDKSLGQNGWIPDPSETVSIGLCSFLVAAVEGNTIGHGSPTQLLPFDWDNTQPVLTPRQCLCCYH